ncbi:MAG: LysM domain-containing protein [bacterium]|nr:LysM domain-containing protein [bacterium]MCY3889697.1 LysM domain-containing protein [bacterium]MCY3960478.1 LysM domain-containing protein [bacterium]MCY4135258.1 LysM domain-containing protein [bacterium]
MRRARVLWMVLMLAVLAAACGGGGGTTSEDRPIGVDSDELVTATVAVPEPTLPPTPTPTSTPEAFIYVVREGDTLGSIADEFGITWQEIDAVNQLENPNVLSIGQEIEIPQDAPVVLNSDGTVRPGERTHIVVAGDTLLDIALQYGKTLDEITAANNIVAAELIQVGQELIIPPDEEEPTS